MRRKLAVVKVYVSAIMLHLFLIFADDSLTLMKAKTHDANTLKRVLDNYCSSSGQLVSNAKSSIFFSPNTNVSMREDVCRKLDIVTEALSEKYLGLPTMIESINVRRDERKKNLSMHKKEILLKSAASNSIF